MRNKETIRECTTPSATLAKTVLGKNSRRLHAPRRYVLVCFILFQDSGFSVDYFVSRQAIICYLRKDGKLLKEYKCYFTFGSLISQAKPSSNVYVFYGIVSRFDRKCTSTAQGNYSRTYIVDNNHTGIGDSCSPEMYAKTIFDIRQASLSNTEFLYASNINGGKCTPTHTISKELFAKDLWQKRPLFQL